MAREVSTAVVLAVAVSKDVGPSELAPLREVLDTEALDALFSSGSDGNDEPTTTEVRFTYEDHDVRVRGVDDVVLEPLGESG